MTPDFSPCARLERLRVPNLPNFAHFLGLDSFLSKDEGASCTEMVVVPTACRSGGSVARRISSGVHSCSPRARFRHAMEEGHREVVGQQTCRAAPDPERG